MLLGRGVIIDLQPIRPQIQHPLHGAMAASYYELVYHLLDKLQIPLGPASALLAAVALVRTIIVKRVLIQRP
jgi:hypothetical protein